VHYVAALPEERGKGLGRAVVVAALHYFRDRGFERVMLGTQGYRTAAVQLYLSLGFHPWPHTDEEREIWETWLGRGRMANGEWRMANGE
jgi:mycothiol synthase